MSEVTLYNVPPSLCSQKVRLALEEKGVAFTNHWVDIGPTSANYEPWYVRLNPKCVVPTLVHGDTIVTDSSRIMQYIDDTFDGVKLFPEAEEKRAQTDRWFKLGETLDFRLFTFAQSPAMFTDLMLNKKLKKLKKYAAKYPDLRAEYEAKFLDMQDLKDRKNDTVVTGEQLKELEATLDEMDELLGEQPYLAGEDYTMADVMWTVVLTRMKFVKAGAMIEQRPNLLAYYARMQTRPSYASADLWPRFKPQRLLVVLAEVFGKRVGIAATVLLGVGLAASMYWMY